MISEKLLCFRYYGGSTLDCIAQTEPLIMKAPPDKFKKFIKYKSKHSNGIENGGFQDEPEITLKTSNSLEDLSTIQKNEENRTGVKKKSPRGLTRSESINISGTKKKIKSSKSPSKEYYQLWAATSTSETDNNNKLEDGYDKDLDEKAPPLPPRSLHRPLERSHALHSNFKPPIVLRQNKPKVISSFFRFKFNRMIVNIF